MAKPRVSREGSEWATPTIHSKTRQPGKRVAVYYPRPGDAGNRSTRGAAPEQMRLPRRPTTSPPTRPAAARDGDPGSLPPHTTTHAPSQVTSEARVVVPGPNPADLDRAPAQGGQDQPLAQEVAPRVAEGVRLGRHVRAVRGGPGAGNATGTTTAAPDASTWFGTGRQSD